MRTHTDTQTTTYNEDGSWIETTEITHYPATKQQKASAAALLGFVTLAPLLPILTIASMEKARLMQDKYRAKRAARKDDN